jgi:LAO/AO transport system kinase
MKAGLMEIADIFVVNKADRPGADGLAREIEASMHDGEKLKEVAVIKCVASEGSGVEQLAQKILALKKSVPLKRNSSGRLQEEARALLRADWEIKIEKKLRKINSLRSFKSSLKI